MADDINQSPDVIPAFGAVEEVIAWLLQLEEEAGRPLPGREQLLAAFPQWASEIVEFMEMNAVMRPPRAGDGIRGVPPSADAITPAASSPVSATLPSDQPTATRKGPPRLRYVGEYELLEEIARGGMGIVYRARQVRLRRAVAVKMILAGDWADPAEVKRFEAEARAAANLQHPNIVAVHEIGTHEGQCYFSMDLVEGRSLAAIARDKPLAPRLAATYLRGIGEAIAYAHTQGIIHRDLKPSNVLIDGQGRPRVTDFGLATRPHAEGETLTLTGQVLGTPAYMSPEQATGKREQIGPTSDVYSLGAILYELLTGRPPFRAATTVETLKQVVERDPVRPRLLAPTAPRDLETICLKCLQKSPSHRYGSAGDLSADLERFLDGRPIVARPIGTVHRALKWARRRPSMAALIAVTVLSIAGYITGSLWYSHQLQVALNDARSQKTVAEERRVVADRQTLLARIRLNAFQLGQAANLSRNDPEAALAILTDPDRCPPELRDFTWRALVRWCDVAERWSIESNDGAATELLYIDQGRTIAGIRGGRVRFWEAAAGQPIADLYGDGGIFGFHGLCAITEGSGIYAGSGDGSIHRWSPAGEPQRVLRRGSLPIQTMAVLPDGGRFAVFQAGMGARGQVAIIPAEADQPPRLLWPDVEQVVALSWIDAGRQVLAVSRSGWIKRFDAETGRALAERRFSDHWMGTAAISPDGGSVAILAAGRVSLLNPLSLEETSGFSVNSGGAHAGAFSADGRLLALAGGIDGAILLLFDARTGEKRGLRRGHRRRISGLAFAPDGASIVSCDDGGTMKQWPVIPGVWDWEERAGAGEIAACVFASDRLVVSSGIVGQPPSLGVWDWHGAKKMKELPGHTNWVGAIAASNDGSLLVTGDRSGVLHIWDLAGEANPKTTKFDEAVNAIAISPDKSSLAVGEGSRIVLCDASGTTKSTLSGHSGEVLSLTFSGNGALLVSASADRTARLWNVATGREQSILQGHDAVVRAVRFAQDTGFIFTAGDDTEGGNIRCWDLHGKQLLSLAGHVGPVLAIDVSPDGKTLASAGRDGTVRLWSTATGQPLASIQGSAGALRTVRFSSQGDALAVGGEDGILRVLRCDSNKRGQP